METKKIQKVKHLLESEELDGWASDFTIDNPVYCIKMMCLNCGREGHQMFMPKQQMISKSILKNSICHYCLCKGTLIKDFKLNKKINNINNHNSADSNDWIVPAAIGFGVGALLD